MKSQFKRDYSSVLTWKWGHVYCLHDKVNNICRIGQTVTEDHRRQKGQMGYYPFELVMYHFRVRNVIHAESYFHKHFSSKRVRADWFSITPKEFMDLQAKYTVDFNKELTKEQANVEEDTRGSAYNPRRKKVPNIVKPKDYKPNTIVKGWFVKVGDRELHCELSRAYPLYHKLILVSDNKAFVVQFANFDGYNYAKNGSRAEVIVQTLNKTKNLTGYAVFKEVKQ